MAERGHRQRLMRPPRKLEALVKRVQPVHMALIYGLIAASLGVWFFVARYNARDIVIISLLVMISAVTFELGRLVIGLREDISPETSVKPCWNESGTVTVLRDIDGLARRDSRVRCVWGALAFSQDFQGFVTDQLDRSVKHNYDVERWVDISKVDYEDLARHLENETALAAMQEGRYVLHLVPETAFGAMVVDNRAAIVNFQAHQAMRGVIGLYGEDDVLAGRVTTMINELEQGLVLPGKKRNKRADQLQKLAREYYAEKVPKMS